MKIVLQRVSEASVESEGRLCGRIGLGVCVLVGVERGDSAEDAEYLAGKIVELRIFPDEAGKMNLSLADVGGAVLAVSQFTLAGSTKRGRRPGFDNAEEPARAQVLFENFSEAVRRRGVPVETGVFQTHMSVRIVNDGPVTFVLDSRRSGGTDEIPR
jgi:D-aminoacyl-tRNA deacylase